MNAAVKIIPEWTLKQWQDHAIQMEKRLNELERAVHNLKERPVSNQTFTQPRTGVWMV